MEEEIIARHNGTKKDSSKLDHRINRAIRAREVLLIDENGVKVGVVPTYKALNLARDVGMDLVEVGASANPPVCKIMDYGQLKYQDKKRAQEAKKKQAVVKVKELKMRPKIDTHDFEVKAKHLVKFIESGYKVRIVVRFRGREVVYAESSKDILFKLFDRVSHLAHIESQPVRTGYTMVMIVAPGVK